MSRFVFLLVMLIMSLTNLSLAESLEEKAIILYNKGRKKEAVKLLESINSKESLKLLINYLTWENKANQAMKKIKIYEEEFGYDTEVTFRKAQLLAWNGRISESRTLLRRLLKEKTPLFPDIVELLGFTYLWEGKKENAKFFLSWAYDLGKREKELLEALKSLSNSQGLPKKKEDIINDKTSPNSPDKSAIELDENQKTTNLTDKDTRDVVFRGEFYLFSDSDNTKFYSKTLGVDVAIKDLALGIKGGDYELNGERGNQWSIYGRIESGIGELEGGVKGYKGTRKTKFRKINPFIALRLFRPNYTLTGSYEEVVMGIYAKSKKAYLKKIYAKKYSLSLSAPLFGKDFWSDITAIRVEDNNLLVIPQFSYNLFNSNYGELTFMPFVAGYYLISKDKREEYYSPKFHDEELVGIDTEYSFTNTIFLSVKPSGGYSFRDKVFIYSIEGALNIHFLSGSISLFVNHSNSGGKLVAYSYDEIGIGGMIRW